MVNVNVQVVGCSHHKSSVAFREQVALSSAQAANFAEEFYLQFPNSELVIVSTCNRTELYTLASKPEDLPSSDLVIELWAKDRSLNADEIAQKLYIHRDESAINHLFAVSASLDSMVVGESQIVAQVKQAYEAAKTYRPATPLTYQVFDTALRVAKRVSTETDIHTNRVSVPSIAINVLATQIFERLDNKDILVLGAGEMAEETLNYLVGHGAKNFTICNRSIERAQQLAKVFSGNVVQWEQIFSQLATADMVISTTGSTEPIVKADSFKSVVGSRDQKPIFILDLAVPRDFEDAIGNELNVYLYSLDDLQMECERNLKSRKNEWPKATRIVESETENFFGEVRRRAGGSTIALLKRQANDVKDEELKRLLNRLDSASTDDKVQIEHSFQRLVNKLLHPPLESIREDSASESNDQPVGLLEAMKRLFQLKD